MSVAKADQASAWLFAVLVRAVKQRMGELNALHLANVAWASRSRSVGRSAFRIAGKGSEAAKGESDAQHLADMTRAPQDRSDERPAVGSAGKGSKAANGRVQCAASRQHGMGAAQVVQAKLRYSQRWQGQ